MAKLDELEARLQSLLEVNLMNFLPGYKAEDKVTQQLAAALHTNLKEKDQVTEAPNVYVIVAHPSTLTRWRAEPRLIKELAEALLTAGNEVGLKFPTKPTVTTAADVSMAPEEIRILASFSYEGVAETRGAPVESKKDTTEAIPKNAFLILQGTKVIPLSHSVINIGRRLDNQIIVDDPRISRAHAQIRTVKGRFVLFDLNSTGGTYVNGQRVNQSVLYPGDVISLAGVTLIYGQDLPVGRSLEDTEETASPLSSDRPTAIVPKEDLKK